DRPAPARGRAGRPAARARRGRRPLGRGRAGRGDRARALRRRRRGRERRAVRRRAGLLRRLILENVALTLAYRGAFFVLMLSTVIGPLISLLIWRTVLDQGVRLPPDRSQLVTYFLLAIVEGLVQVGWSP